MVSEAIVLVCSLLQVWRERGWYRTGMKNSVTTSSYVELVCVMLYVQYMHKSWYA